MPNRLKPLLIQQQMTVRDVMARIDEGGLGISLLIDDDCRFIRTVTDGDLRRAIIRGHGLDTDVATALPPQSQPSITAPVGTSSDEQLEIMLAAEVRHLPLLNADGTIADLTCSDNLISEEVSMQAVIMAGGFGTRLRPLTDNTPKPMLSIGGKPLMERTIENLQKAGIHRINVTTHYLPEKITQHFGAGERFGVDLNYVSEDQPLGTAGALRLISEVEEPLLVMNGDILTNVDFRALMKFHREHSAALTVGVRQYEFQVPYGVIDADEGVIRGLREKPRMSFLVNAGIYLLEPSVIRHIPVGQRYDMTDLIEELVRTGSRVVTFPFMEYWLDIGKHDDFEKAQEDVSKVRWAA
ncbi:MAG: nucleotidyltransferase family protein [Planctomycetaceae bacterium]|nr:nucleotidyltransferase family protein [Planctomycetaceae bacterium]